MVVPPYLLPDPPYPQNDQSLAAQSTWRPSRSVADVLLLLRPDVPTRALLSTEGVLTLGILAFIGLFITWLVLTYSTGKSPQLA